MTASLAINLILLVLVGALLIWFPDQLTLVPLILAKVKPGPLPAGPTSTSSPRPRPGARRAKAKVPKKPRKKRTLTRR